MNRRFLVQVAFCATFVLASTLPLYHDLNTTLALKSRQEVDPATALNFWGNSCDGAGDKDAVKQAWKDALDFAQAVGNPDEINFDGWLERDYYGKKGYGADVPKLLGQVRENWKRFQAVPGHTSFGDWWYNRYVIFACRDGVDRGMAGAKHHCGDNAYGMRAQAIEQPIDNSIPGSKTFQNIIVLCDNWFDTPSTGSTMQNVDNSDAYPRNNVKTMVSQGTIMMHEMYHIQYLSGTNEEGLTDPQGKDVSLYDDHKKSSIAYGAAKSKYLAWPGRAGLQLALTNPDNSVNYAVARWMMNRWSQNVTLPERGWPGINPTAPSFDTSDGLIDDSWNMSNIPSLQNLDPLDPDSTVIIVDDDGESGPADFDYYGGNSCSVESDCEGTCIPGVLSYCWEADKTCRCGVEVDPTV